MFAEKSNPTRSYDNATAIENSAESLRSLEFQTAEILQVTLDAALALVGWLAGGAPTPRDKPVSDMPTLQRAFENRTLASNLQQVVLQLNSLLS